MTDNTRQVAYATAFDYLRRQHDFAIDIVELENGIVPDLSEQNYKKLLNSPDFETYALKKIGITKAVKQEIINSPVGRFMKAVDDYWREHKCSSVTACRYILSTLQEDETQRIAMFGATSEEEINESLDILNQVATDLEEKLSNPEYESSRQSAQSRDFSKLNEEALFDVKVAAMYTQYLRNESVPSEKLLDFPTFCEKVGLNLNFKNFNSERRFNESQLSTMMQRAYEVAQDPANAGRREEALMALQSEELIGNENYSHTPTITDVIYDDRSHLINSDSTASTANVYDKYGNVITYTDENTAKLIMKLSMDYSRDFEFETDENGFPIVDENGHPPKKQERRTEKENPYIFVPKQETEEDDHTDTTTDDETTTNNKTTTDDETNTTGGGDDRNNGNGNNGGGNNGGGEDSSGGNNSTGGNKGISTELDPNIIYLLLLNMQNELTSLKTEVSELKTKIIDDIATKIIEEVSTKLVEEISTKISEEISTKISEEISTKISEEISIIINEEINKNDKTDDEKNKKTDDKEEDDINGEEEDDINGEEEEEDDINGEEEEDDDINGEEEEDDDINGEEEEEDDINEEEEDDDINGEENKDDSTFNRDLAVKFLAVYMKTTQDYRENFEDRTTHNQTVALTSTELRQAPSLREMIQNEKFVSKYPDLVGVYTHLEEIGLLDHCEQIATMWLYGHYNDQMPFYDVVASITRTDDATMQKVLNIADINHASESRSIFNDALDYLNSLNKVEDIEKTPVVVIDDEEEDDDEEEEVVVPRPTPKPIPQQTIVQKQSTSDKLPDSALSSVANYILDQYDNKQHYRARNKGYHYNASKIVSFNKSGHISTQEDAQFFEKIGLSTMLNFAMNYEWSESSVGLDVAIQNVMNMSAQELAQKTGLSPEQVVACRQVISETSDFTEKHRNNYSYLTFHATKHPKTDLQAENASIDTSGFTHPSSSRITTTTQINGPKTDEEAVFKMFGDYLSAAQTATTPIDFDQFAKQSGIFDKYPQFEQYLDYIRFPQYIAHACKTLDTGKQFNMGAEIQSNMGAILESMVTGKPFIWYMNGHEQEAEEFATDLIKYVKDHKEEFPNLDFDISKGIVMEAPRPDPEQEEKAHRAFMKGFKKPTKFVTVTDQQEQDQVEIQGPPVDEFGHMRYYDQQFGETFENATEQPQQHEETTQSQQEEQVEGMHRPEDSIQKYSETEFEPLNDENAYYDEYGNIIDMQGNIIGAENAQSSQEEQQDVNLMYQGQTFDDRRVDELGNVYSFEGEYLGHIDDYKQQLEEQSPGNPQKDEDLEA